MKTDCFGRNLQDVFVCENVDIVVSAEIEMATPRDIGLMLFPTGLEIGFDYRIHSKRNELCPENGASGTGFPLLYSIFPGAIFSDSPSGVSVCPVPPRGGEVLSQSAGRYR